MESPGTGSVDPALHPPIAFADEDWAWFCARCADLGVPDADSRRQRLEAIYGHLVGVNAWLNLTRITGPRDYLKQHVLDSLVVVNDPRLKHLSEGDWCADLGSGGGYPGLPLALWFPRVPWALLDARRRKAEFLAAAAPLTGATRIMALHLRGADVVQAKGAHTVLRRACQLVVSRAMAQTAEVLQESAQLVQRHGHCLIFKGPAYFGPEREEGLRIGEKLDFRLVSEKRLQLEPGDPERVIVAYERMH